MSLVGGGLKIKGIPWNETIFSSPPHTTPIYFNRSCAPKYRPANPHRRQQPSDDCKMAGILNWLGRASSGHVHGFYVVANVRPPELPLLLQAHAESKWRTWSCRRVGRVARLILQSSALPRSGISDGCSILDVSGCSTTWQRHPSPLTWCVS